MHFIVWCIHFTIDTNISHQYIIDLSAISYQRERCNIQTFYHLIVFKLLLKVEKLVFDKDANVVYVHLLDGAVINDEPVQKPVCCHLQILWCMR